MKKKLNLKLNNKKTKNFVFIGKVKKKQNLNYEY